MGKVRITESELRQIIRESVISEITEAQKDRFNRRYNAYNTAVQNYNNNFSKNWADLSDIEKQKWQDEYNKIKSAPNSSGSSYDISPESIYNSRKNNAQTTMDQALNRRGVGAKMKEQLDNVNRQLNGIRNALGASEQEGYLGIVQRINGLNQKAKDLEAANTALSTLRGALGAKDQATALKNAGDYTRAARQWYAYQKQLKTSTQQTAAANQQTPQEPQTMMAETKEEGIGDTVKTAAQKVRNTTRNTLGKVKKTVNNTKQAVGNAAKSWVDKRDALEKERSNNPYSTLASNYINRF